MRRLGTIGLVLWSATLALGASAQPLEGVPVDPDEPLQEPTVQVVGPDKPVPRNGSILLLMAADPVFSDLAQEPFVQVSQAEGGVIRTFGGSLRRVVDSYWAWKPAQPLDPGEYLVSVADAIFGTASATITVVGDAVLEPPALTAEPLAVTSSILSGQAYCRSDRTDHASGFPLFATHERIAVFVQPQESFDAGPEVAHQFLYRVFTSDFDLSPFRSSDALLATGPFIRPAGEYCVRVQAMDIATSTVHAYPGVELCAPHRAELGELGERAVSVADEQLSRYACSWPPEGYEERWCQVNEQCIEIWENENIIDVNGCREYFEFCPDAERPDAGTTGTGGAGGRIDFEPTDSGAPDERTPRTDAGDGAPAGDGDDCGCSTVRATEPASRTTLGLAALALLLCVRALRRAHCRGVASTQASSAR